MSPNLVLQIQFRRAALIVGSLQSMMAAITLSLSAHAQSPQPSPAPADAPNAASSAPRYSGSELKQAFEYMDANHDGKISREEAASFRGVAKNFDRADNNHDGFLSRDEFDAAMNYVKQP